METAMVPSTSTPLGMKKGALEVCVRERNAEGQEASAFLGSPEKNHDQVN